jgi:hypothetical protein
VQKNLELSLRILDELHTHEAKDKLDYDGRVLLINALQDVDSVARHVQLAKKGFGMLNRVYEVGTKNYVTEMLDAAAVNTSTNFANWPFTAGAQIWRTYIVGADRHVGFAKLPLHIQAALTWGGKLYSVLGAISRYKAMDPKDEYIHLHAIERLRERAYTRYRWKVTRKRKRKDDGEFDDAAEKDATLDDACATAKRDFVCVNQMRGREVSKKETYRSDFNRTFVYYMKKDQLPFDVRTARRHVVFDAGDNHILELSRNPPLLPPMDKATPNDKVPGCDVGDVPRDDGGSEYECVQEGVLYASGRFYFICYDASYPQVSVELLTSGQSNG